VSLGDVEAEPERALLLTVRRYDTVQDGAATRLAAQAGGTRRALQPGALVRSLYLRALPASPPPPAIEAQPAKLMRQPPDCVLDYPWPADYRRNNVMKMVFRPGGKKDEARSPAPVGFDRPVSNGADLEAHLSHNGSHNRRSNSNRRVSTM
jgi:hypothetical protein